MTATIRNDAIFFGALRLMDAPKGNAAHKVCEFVNRREGRIQFAIEVDDQREIGRVVAEAKAAAGL